ncbi:hypothetical protein CABS01_12376 [Colletotrichum abscissum]|uniref:uncharacterized protein n=1 Tax=Colletotrichum abscissum TaxID=1671311 RepID=UPI0027D7492C|nr:uncharacterized protein CABS01_12376 [Colletotrichum abscissum]KAK1490576.1 hypothetical protein CABS01_12376 [Colletotrichum abscissum]
MDTTSDCAVVNGYGIRGSLDFSQRSHDSRIEYAKVDRTERLQSFLADKGPGTMMPCMTASSERSLVKHRAKASQKINETMAKFER